MPQLPPAQPTPSDMLGAEIRYRHNNRFLYPFEYQGVIRDMMEYTGKNAPTGTYLLVKSPAFSVAHWIHEDNLISYVRTNETAAFAAAS